MKIKKIQILRPEIEVEFIKPILGRLYFASKLPRLIKIYKQKIDLCIMSPVRPIHEYKGTVKRINVWYLCIPKIKVVKSE